MRKYSAGKLAEALGGEEAAELRLEVNDLRQATVAAWFARQVLGDEDAIDYDVRVAREAAVHGGVEHLAVRMVEWGALAQEKHGLGWQAVGEIARAFFAERLGMKEAGW